MAHRINTPADSISAGIPAAVKRSPNDRVAALAGNPNVGKSTVFNALTGMNQHTGNWPGKTVATARGRCSTGGCSWELVDIPGTYSLMAHSAEEEVARDFICFGAPDAVIVVCDATCLERNLNLVLQTIEITPNVIVCVNLLDEAERKNIHIDLPLLSERLGVPVVGVVARKKKSLSALLSAMDGLGHGASQPPRVRYPDTIETAVRILEPSVQVKCGGRLDARWLSLRLLDPDPALEAGITDFLGEDILRDAAIRTALGEAETYLYANGIGPDRYKDLIVSALVATAEDICRGAVILGKGGYAPRDRRLDRLLTGKLTGYPVMIGLLALILWITITGANYPSQLLAAGLFRLQSYLTDLFRFLGAPEWLHGALVLGVYRVLAWVVSVMLPPMAIFFPLFTLLEDAGYLPRVAYNLDRPFKRCCACGKQALTMCMVYIILNTNAKKPCN